MKKLFLILSVAMFSLGTVDAFAQDNANEGAATEQAAVAETTTVADVDAEATIAGESMHHVMMQKFLAQIEEALKNGGIDAAMEVARNTRGPIASIYYQGLSRYGQGLDAVEKSVVSYGSVQTGLMESGLSWIGLFIALSPMLGFMGTVVGMIAAFDAIQAAGDISPTLVAGGIKVALLTTLMGLIAAVILQLFYNYIVAKIDSLVNEMEDTSIVLMDMLTAYKK